MKATSLRPPEGSRCSYARQGPRANPLPPASDSFSSPWASRRATRFSAVGGFYSIRAMSAMAVATVIARRYHNHRSGVFRCLWNGRRYLLSRITTSNHFPADVVFGGAMGYVISRYAVLPVRF